MLACDKTVTVVRYDSKGETYILHRLVGVSWYEKLKVAVQDKGLAGANQFTVRVPAAALPDGFMPRVSDVVVDGVVTTPIEKAKDLAPYHHFTVLGVGDNRRPTSRIPHVVVSGA